MTLFKELFIRVLPRRWVEALEAESGLWSHCCRCGFERFGGDTGSRRGAAAGAARYLMECSRCGQMTWHTCRQKLKAQSLENTRSDPPRPVPKRVRPGNLQSATKS